MGSKSDGGRAAALAAKTAFDKQRYEEAKKEKVTDLDKQLALQAAIESPELVGLLQGVDIDPGDLEKWNLDPRLLGIQEDYLAELQDKAREGITPQQRAQMEEFQRMSDARDQARQAQIMQQMAQQGTLGGGQQLAMQIASGQQAAMQDAANARDMAAQAEAGKMSALERASNVSGGLMRDKNEVARNAEQAKYIRNKFAAMNRQDINQRNLALRQDYADKATETRNLRRTGEMDVRQKDFDNRMARLGQVNQIGNSYSSSLGQNFGTPQKSGLQKGLAAAGAGAQIGNTIAPGGWGAGIGAGVGALGSMFAADGGVKKYADGSDFDEFAQLERERKQSELENDFGGDRYKQAIYGKRRTTDRANKMFQSSALGKALGFGQSEPAPVAKPAPAPIVKPKESMDSLVSQGKTYDEVSKMADQEALDRQRGEGIAKGLTALSELFAHGGVKRGMNYENGGEGAIIDSGMDSFSGDQLPDRINDGEMVLNVKQQERLNQMLQELRALRRMHSGVEEGPRVDEQLDADEFEINDEQQEALMALLRGEIDPEDLPEDDILED